MDMNGNRYPEIYNTLGEHNLNIDLAAQVVDIRAMMERAGLRHIPTSSYLWKCRRVGYSDYKTELENFIMPYWQRNLPTPGAQDSKVFVWDINEITMLSRRHMMEIEYLKPNLPTDAFVLPAGLLVKLGFEDNDFTRDIVTNISDIYLGRSDFVRKTAPKYEALRTVYEAFSGANENIGPIIREELIELCGKSGEQSLIYESATALQRIYNNRWRTVSKCMNLINRRSAEAEEKTYSNVVICDSEIALAASELMVSMHSSAIPLENIYSSSGVSLKKLKKTIQGKFGKNCMFIGHNNEINLPFWRVTANESLEHLYQALNEIILK